MASTQMVRKWEVPEHPEIEWALRTGYPSWMQEKGSDASAASGGRSELSQWQRSKKSRKSVSPMIFSGTANGTAPIGGRSKGQAQNPHECAFRNQHCGPI